MGMDGPTKSIAELVNDAFANPANTVSDSERSGFSQALELPEPDRQKALDKMVRANMGFKVSLQK